MITYQAEPWSQVEAEFDELGRMNFEECRVSDNKRPYALDHSTLRALGKDVHLTTARDEERLIGYILSVISPKHLQYEACCSQHIGFYVHPDYRNQNIGMKLLKEDENFLKSMGVEKMYGGFTMEVDLSPLFMRRGWKEAEKIYVKWIGE